MYIYTLLVAIQIQQKQPTAQRSINHNFSTQRNYQQQ